MRTERLLLALALPLALATGCESTSLVLPVTCAARDGSVCADLLRVPDGLSAQAACQSAVSPDPVYGAEEPCPLSAAAGYCDVTVSAVRMEIAYYTPPYTPPGAGAACAQLGGTFRAAAGSPPEASP